MDIKARVFNPPDFRAAPMRRAVVPAELVSPDRKIYLDYIRGAAPSKPFFAHDPHDPEAFNKAAEAHDNERSSPAYGWYFLAMCHHKLGQPAEAKQWFDKAAEWTNKVLDESRKDYKPVSWNRKLTLELLRAETKTLLGVTDADDPPKPPSPDGATP